MQTDTTLTPEYEAELESFLADGGTIAMLKDISGDTLEQLYALAFGQYQSGKWQDAHKISRPSACWITTSRVTSSGSVPAVRRWVSTKRQFRATASAPCSI